MSVWTRRLALSTAFFIVAAVAGPACAQTKLKWAHVYETGEPYHTEALWAAGEIKKRTNGKYEIEVFPASQLGNENQLNEGLGLGTVDIIYTGVNFAAATYKPLGITGAPFILRDFDHWKAYRESKLFQDLAKGYDDKTRHRIVALTYYGQRHVTANRSITKPEDMKGMKLRVPPAPLFLMFTKSVGANATPIAFAEVYLALQQGTVDGQENPLPTIMAKKFYEVQSHIILTAHHGIAGDGGGQPRLVEAHARRAEDFWGCAEGSRFARDRCDRSVRENPGRGIQEARQDRGRARPRGLPQGGDPAAQRCVRRRRLDPGAV